MKVQSVEQESTVGGTGSHNIVTDEKLKDIKRGQLYIYI
jgi:hypothetical protein